MCGLEWTETVHGELHHEASVYYQENRDSHYVIGNASFHKTRVQVFTWTTMFRSFTTSRISVSLLACSQLTIRMKRLSKQTRA